MPGDTTTAGTPVWYGGGKLAADLTWPRLTRRWTPATTPATAAPGPAGGLTAAERAAAWDHAARIAGQAAARIRDLAGTNPAAAGDAAWAASGTLHATAALLGSRLLRQAADAYDRAARPPGATPRTRPRPGTSSATPPASSPHTPASPANPPSRP
jgi:hypothetical protein